MLKQETSEVFLLSIDCLINVLHSISSVFQFKLEQPGLEVLKCFSCSIHMDMKLQ